MTVSGLTIAAIMGILLLVFIFSGYYLFAALGGVAILSGLAFWGPGVFQTVYFSIFKYCKDYNLLAVPLFVLMGQLLNQSGVAGRLFDNLSVALGRQRGGMAIAATLIAILFAATTGIVGASVVSMGLLFVGPMLDAKYNKSLTAGVIVSGGTLGILIPPSIMLVFMGSAANVSVGQLFYGAIVPGLLLGAAYIVYIKIVAVVKKDYTPPMPAEQLARYSRKQVIWGVIVNVLPVALVIFSVLGAIWLGWCPATEAAALGVKVIEIPTDPETGISVEALELALEQWPIKGIILVPNCNNPLGFIMPDARKRAVLSLAQRHDIVIFEDDVYGELATEYPRPRTIHSWDIDGRVLLCSSFSKSIAPGLRVGWVAPGRYHDKLLHMKYATSSFNVPSTQMAAATFVLEGHYHRHIRRIRQNYQRNLALYTCWIREYFPCEICITRPKGGFLLWIELPEQVDMVCVARQLCRMNIQVAAGSIFSASGKYRNCLRINCALPLSETYREALKQIGEAVYRAME